MSGNGAQRFRQPTRSLSAGHQRQFDRILLRGSESAERLLGVSATVLDQLAYGGKARLPMAEKVEAGIDRLGGAA